MSEPAGRAGHLIGLLDRRLHAGLLLERTPGPVEDRIRLRREYLPSVLAFCKRDPDADLDLLVDETCVDRGEDAEGERFEIVLRLRSSRLGYRLMIRLPVPEDDPSFPSATPHYAAANWLEREVHDLFGVFPDGHPFLRRLLMYPGFTGHPLRRDYPPAKTQPLVALKQLGPPAAVVEADGSLRAAPARKAGPDAEEGGP